MHGLDTATWRKATASQDQGACVEVAMTERFVGVRDSKNADGPNLTFSAHAAAAFVRAAKQGRHDLV
ncbi:DUF397 domain-containing protein [Solihabitans fulvus]|uniref:DUF397 domain-containing protein n=1 Tax=Solihabitans fulvus TaxID=1892852 RepID=A0A5B2W5U8_9PSEU|nr:DUF397 domain-containing protein [Solihabitans fulvus]KAA2247313.1 DUF397 domain-containing protein [Solihabitans fulvus]